MQTPHILLITPPLTQLNTPYPATAYLTGFLKKQGYQVSQVDLGIGLVLTIFSANGFKRLFEAIRQGNYQLSHNAKRIMRLEKSYLQTIDAVIRFLQNKDSTLAHRICTPGFLPEASRFAALEDMDWAFGSLGIQDRARFLATLYIEDIGDLIIETVSPHFGFSRYAERLAMSATSFTPLNDALQQPDNFTDTLLLEILAQKLADIQPNLIGFTVPFPGNLYGALKCGQFIKKNYPHIPLMLGGGYANTELRDLSEPQVFDYIDFIILDDGEGPLLHILEHIQGKRPLELLQRTFVRQNGAVKYMNGSQEPDIAHSEIGTPDYSGLMLDQYLSVIEVANPMHRLWSDGRWNKLTVAHGCYWKRCSFCDITLDYIRRYDTAPARMLVDRIEALIAQTGQTGFHFVDEAAPPLALRDLAIELIRRGVRITWWANIRFEKTFTADLCRLLAASGCIAVSGGLEVASDRLLEKMEKGVTIQQVARVTHHFTEAGILVHAYLMYGFPTQTAQETIDSLEVVRQLFANGVIQSGYWHRFAMTAHSPVGQNPEKYGVELIGPNKGTFAWNDLAHHDPKGCDHAMFGDGLSKALYNFMHGIGLDYRLADWFTFKTPRTTLPPTLIERAINTPENTTLKRQSHRAIWLGNQPDFEKVEETKKGKHLSRTKLSFFEQTEDFTLKTDEKTGEWLQSIFPALLIGDKPNITLESLAVSYTQATGNNWDTFTQSPLWATLRQKNLMLIWF